MHWNKYTGLGVRFYLFIGNNNKVALALYPDAFDLNSVIGNLFIVKTNCQIYNEQDDLDYGLFLNLPINLINAHIVFEVIQEENGLYIKDNVLFKCNRRLKNVVIPDGITKIADKAFVLCKKLKTVTIPNGVTSVGYMAFWDCEHLTNITIPNSVTSIGNSAFQYCKSLTSITIPNSVTSIKREAFRDCSSLTSITIGSGVTSIGIGAFWGCPNLTNISVDKNNPNYKVVDGHLYDKNDKMIV